MPKVSIIVPIYNVGQYLTKCIESLINQTLEDIEIILVDDGATDNSTEICDEYALRDNRIKVIHKQNGGLSDARNTGIDVAKGEYLAFLDSDDWIEPNFYEYLYNVIQREQADIVQCDYIEAYNEDIVIQFNECIKENMYTGVEALTLLYGPEYIRTVIACSKIYKKELFVGIRFPKGKIHEDEFTTYKLLHKASKVVDSNVKMYYYRQREGSIMAQGFNEKRLHVVEAWKERINYFNQYTLEELAQRTESNLCRMLKALYAQAKQSNSNNKKKILKSLKKDMQKYYIAFIKNRHITNKGKIMLTICILNETVFCNLYNRYGECIGRSWRKQKD